MLSHISNLFILLITILYITKNNALYLSKLPIYQHSRILSSTRKLSMSIQYMKTNNINQYEDDKDMKLGVLLLNLGGPETIEDVEGFLYNLFADPDIIRLPSLLSILQKPLAYFIAKRRAPQSSAAYKTIGGGSPIVKYTRQQAKLIEDNLHIDGYTNAKCYFAMRYWNPFTEEVLEEIQRDGINTLVILPLYPQYSISTSGSSLKLLQDIFYKNKSIWGNDKVLHTVIPSWYYRKGYIQAVARLVVKEIEMIRTVGSSPFESKHKKMDDSHIVVSTDNNEVDVLFSAHGVPKSYIFAGDPYQQQIEDCVSLVSMEVQSMIRKTHGLSKDDNLNMHFHLSYQSRVGPVEWLKPYTEDTIEYLGKEKKVQKLVVVPISFVSEHIETLEEIDMEYRELAEESGISMWRRVPALNTDKFFIKDMSDMIIEALESPLVGLSEALVPNTFPMPDINDKSNEIVEVSKTLPKSNKNLLNGKFAVIGFLGTTVMELLNGHPMLHILGLR